MGLSYSVKVPYHLFSIQKPDDLLKTYISPGSRVPHQVPKRPTPRHIIIKMPKVKDKERSVKAAREKQLVT